MSRRATQMESVRAMLMFAAVLIIAIILLYMVVSRRVDPDKTDAISGLLQPLFDRLGKGLG